VFTLPGTAQDLQETFEQELITACRENHTARIDSLILKHRLWVKPLVDRLISEYIAEILYDDATDTSWKKDVAGLIALSFQDIYEEKSLVLAAGYLARWDNKEIEKKSIADSLYAYATSLRLADQEAVTAINTYLQALEIYRELEDVRGESVVLGGLGYLYLYRDTDTCLSYYHAALEARKSVDDRQLIASCLNGIGRIHHDIKNDYEKALEYFIKAAEIRVEIGDWLALGNTYTVSAWACEDMGKLEMAAMYYDQSFEAYRKAGNQPRMVNARISSAMIHKLNGQYTEALNDLQEAYKISEEAKDTRGMGDALTQLAHVYAQLGDFDTAVEMCTTALPVFEEAQDNWGIAGVYNNLGIILQDAGRIDRAADFYENALEIYDTLNEQQDVLIVLINLGTIEFDRKNFHQAKEHHSRGLEISRNINARSEEMICLLNLANDQNRLGKLDDALSNYDTALQLAETLDSPEIQWKCMVGKGENYKLRGDYSRAIEYNEAGLRGIEEIRATLPQEEYRTSYMARERIAYEDVIHMLGELHGSDPDKDYDVMAFHFAQRSKSRTFLDLLSQSESGESEQSSGGQSTPATLDVVQASINDKNTVLLEYSLGDSSSYVWIITQKDHQLIELPARSTLKEQIETLRFAILNPQQDNQEFFFNSSTFLYDQLIRPAEAHFSKKSNLVIFPDGILHYLPFETLITVKASSYSGISYSDLPYLINQYPISYGHSSSVLLNMMEDQSSDKVPEKESETLMAFGDPLYNSTKSLSDQNRDVFSRLIHSGREVEKIASQFQESSKEVYLRENAIEENFKNNPELQKFKFIHFATHGIIDEDNPENSSLVLTQGHDSPEDGFLQAAEIYNLELDADLVVLSACQSGLGKMIQGEGIIGLTRAFMFAGIPSVVASLWNVSDASTAIFMHRFYENLIQKKLSTTDALTQARISMIKDGQYAHPFFWAPFVLIGDWR
jgi:CHAT domain-containing protein/Tfp pilus assembly protein PilF